MYSKLTFHLLKSLATSCSVLFPVAQKWIRLVKRFALALVDHWHAHLGRCIKYYDADGDGGLTEFHTTLVYDCTDSVLWLGFGMRGLEFSNALTSYPIYILSTSCLHPIQNAAVQTVPKALSRTTRWMHTSMSWLASPRCKSENGIEWHRIALLTYILYIYIQYVIIYDISIHVSTWYIISSDNLK